MQTVQSGLLFGGLVGAVVGAVAAWLFPFSGSAPQWSMLAMLTVAGALVGAWAASLIGASSPRRRVDRFGAALRAGSILLMVDLPRERVDEIEKRLGRLHPEARLERVEPRTHAFP
jgi:uncharacterized membrane protein